MSNVQDNGNTLALREQEQHPTSMQPASATAQASAMARSRVEAAYLVAMRRPRQIDDVRTMVLKECQRKGFAQKALYSLPIGGEPIIGPSIRLAEAFARLMGNMESKAITLYEDDDKQLIEVAVTDFESNTAYSEQFTVEKVIERRRLKKNQKPVSSRLNSYGDRVYLVRATERDFTAKRRAEISKAMRTCILRHVPDDIKDEAIGQARATIASGAAKDPDAYRRQLVDAFADIGVRAADLRDYLGHGLDGASPHELAELRAVYQTVKAGEANWRECVSAKTGVLSDEESDPHAVLKETIRQKLASQKKGGKRRRPQPKKAAPEKSEIPEGYEQDPATGELLAMPGSDG